MVVVAWARLRRKGGWEGGKEEGQQNSDLRKGKGSGVKPNTGTGGQAYGCGTRDMYM